MPDQSRALSLAASAAEKPVYEPATVVRHIAHELRQPLSTIESIAFYLDMVLPRTEVKARRQIAKLQQEVQQVNWILSDAIHFLRAEPLRPQLLDLSEVVHKNLSEWGSPDGPVLTLILGQDLPPASLDLEQIQHLIRNILAFFRRISGPGCSITVTTVSAPDAAVLEVATNAGEFNEADIQPLFDPFDAHLPGGSGLGLASVCRIAQAHGAQVIASPGNPAGFRLTISFPAA